MPSRFGFLPPTTMLFFAKEDTVKRHVTNILAKLRANDRTHAVTIGLKRGILEL